MVLSRRGQIEPLNQPPQSHLEGSGSPKPSKRVQAVRIPRCSSVVSREDPDQRSRGIAMKKHVRRLPVLSLLTLGILLCSVFAATSTGRVRAMAFPVADIFFELNDSAGDLGIHGEIDGGPWTTLEVEGPGDRRNWPSRALNPHWLCTFCRHEISAHYGRHGRTAREMPLLEDAPASLRPPWMPVSPTGPVGVGIGGPSTWTWSTSSTQKTSSRSTRRSSSIPRPTAPGSSSGPKTRGFHSSRPSGFASGSESRRRRRPTSGEDFNG